MACGLLADKGFRSALPLMSYGGVGCLGTQSKFRHVEYVRCIIQGKKNLFRYHCSLGQILNDDIPLVR